MAREISRLERPHSKCSRSVSVILRMDNLLLVMWSPGKNLRGCHGYPAYRYVSNFTVLFDVESVSSLLWNGCPVWRGMRVQFEREFAKRVTFFMQRNGAAPGLGLVFGFFFCVYFLVTFFLHTLFGHTRISSPPKQYLKKHLYGFCTRKIQFCTSQPNLCDKQLRPIARLMTVRFCRFVRVSSFYPHL